MEILTFVLDCVILTLVIVESSSFFLDQLVGLLSVIKVIELPLAPIVPTKGLLIERAV